MNGRFQPVTTLLLATTIVAACGGEQPSAPASVVEPVLARASMRAQQRLEVPIRIQKTEAVAVQMDIVYDPDALELEHNVRRSVPGGDKEFVVTHLGKGRARVVVFGMNLDPLPGDFMGAVPLVARRAAKDVEVRVENCVVSDRRGRMLEHEFSDGELVVAMKEVSHAR